MKRYIIYLLPIIIGNAAFGQTADFSKAHTAFLLGMFNDYNGRPYVPHHPEESKLVTTFFHSELNGFWRNNWEKLSVYFKYDEAIHKMIYTTNTSKVSTGSLPFRYGPAEANLPGPPADQ